MPSSLSASMSLTDKISERVRAVPRSGIREFFELVLAAGDVIRSTQSAVVLENLISQFLFSKAAEPAPAAGAGAGTAPPGKEEKK